MNSIICIPAGFVQHFRRSWPCSGLEATDVTVSLSRAGDLEDIHGIRRGMVDSDTLTSLIADYLHHMATEQDSRMRTPFDRCADTPCPHRMKG